MGNPIKIVNSVQNKENLSLYSLEKDSSNRYIGIYFEVFFIECLCH